MMASNVFLFTWKDKDSLDKYSLDKELKRRKDTFVQKYWADAVFVFNSENWDNGNIIQNIFWGWLFSAKKLIILRWVPVSAERQTWFDSDTLNEFVDKFMKSIDSIPADNLVVFLSYYPDRRWRLYKFLENNAQVKEFKKMWWIELKNLIRNELWDIKIAENVMTYFLWKVWDDPYRVSSEVDKLREYCSVYNITNIDEKLVDEIVFWQAETVAFWFMELLLKDKDKAIEYLDRIRQEWTNRNEFAWALYYQLKMDIILDDYHQKWIKDYKQIAAECKLNPWAVWNSMKNIGQISKNWNELRNMYNWLVQTDGGIKMWKVKEEEFWLNIKKMWLKFNV